jgi:hypothetical protein
MIFRKTRIAIAKDISQVIENTCAFRGKALGTLIAVRKVVLAERQHLSAPSISSFRRQQLAFRKAYQRCSDAARYVKSTSNV